LKEAAEQAGFVEKTMVAREATERSEQQGLHQIELLNPVAVV
jgi:hypothetical protein